MPMLLSTASRRVGITLLAIGFASQADAVTVQADSSTPVLIGVLTAGQSYSVTASGIADLLVGFNGGEGLTFTADGKPTYAFPAPYSALYPNGLDYDPSVGPGDYGIGGPGLLVGSLIGTYSASPSGPSAYFEIGLGTTLTPSVTETLYGVVNDTYFPDNSATGYSVTLTPTTVTAAVPEPETGALLLAGLGALGWVVRRHRSA